jgi:hypothetical protein
MRIPKKLLTLAPVWLCLSLSNTSGEEISSGPIYSEFRLTLSLGERKEALGPLFNFQEMESQRQWAVPPLFSYTRDDATEASEFDLLYPLVTYDRYGAEYRFQLLQLLSFTGGQSQAATNAHRTTLFPIYFHQRSDDPAKNYTAFFPIYGRIQDRFLRDDVRFAMWPLYLQSRKRDVVTDNYLYPIVHLRHGNHLEGWQVWPLIGHERKDATTRTNHWGDTEVVGGHEKFFGPWPIFFNQKTGIGTTNEQWQQAFLPLYSFSKSPMRDSSTAPWPLGFTYTDDRGKKYREWGAPWPLIVFARGEGKTVNRVWPLFGRGYNRTLESTFYLWPVYKYNRLHSEPLDRERTRILFFLYSDVSEKNTETGAARKRRDCWPFFTWHQDFDGKERLQLLAPLEPIVPNNKNVERNYSPLWSIWRAEQNPKTGAASQSFLWNLYRRETTPETKKCSLLFGLFRYQSTPDAKRWHLFYVPIGRRNPSSIEAPKN